MVKCCFARLSPLAKGRIIGLREKGEKRSVIRNKVRKKDGKKPSIGTVDQVLAHFEEDLEWDGLEERTAGGRPRALTSQHESKVKKVLLRDVEGGAASQSGSDHSANGCARVLCLLGLGLAGAGGVHLCFLGSCLGFSMCWLAPVMKRFCWSGLALVTQPRLASTSSLRLT